MKRVGGFHQQQAGNVNLVLLVARSNSFLPVREEYTPDFSASVIAISPSQWWASIARGRGAILTAWDQLSEQIGVKPFKGLDMGKEMFSAQDGGQN